MSLFKSIFAAFAVVFSSAALVAPLASAQGATVGVIDYSKVERDSKAGANIRQQLETIDDGLKAELAPVKTQAENALNVVKPKIDGLNPQQIQAKGQSDPAFAQEYVAYMQAKQAYDQNTQRAALVLQATSTEAWKTFDRQANSLLEQVATEAGAGVILERKNVMYVSPSVDLTSKLIAKLDATMPTVTVVRQNNIEVVVGRNGQILGAQAADETQQ